MSVAENAKIAEELLKIKAVKLQPENPFHWASGWRSPVYCDNRLTLSYPALRGHILQALLDLAKQAFGEFGGVAGVATAGIPQGALIADRLGLPFVYIRSSAKKHGMTNQIEGRVEEGMSYLVVEDLVSTGGSSLKAVEALKDAGGKIAGVISVFNYGFPEAEAAFAAADCPHAAVLGLELLLEKAVEIGYIRGEELEVIRQWRQDPAAWTRHFVENGAEEARN